MVNRLRNSFLKAFIICFVLVLSCNYSLQAQCKVLVTASAITCGGGCNGQLTAIGSKGTPPYTYNWGTGTSTNQITGLCPGTYSVSVTDKEGWFISEWQT